MIKIITFNDIQLKSVELCENEGKVFAYVIYSLKEKSGKVWEQRQYVLKDEDFTIVEKQKIKQILVAAYNKIKQKEEIM